MKTAYKAFPASSLAVDPVTGASYTSQYDIFTIGAGYLDVAAAISNTDLAPNTAGSAASPTAYYDSNSGNVYVKNTATSVAWGSSSAWNSAAVWGTTVFLGGTAATWGTAAVWSTAAVWGTNVTSGFAAVGYSSGVGNLRNRRDRSYTDHDYG